MNLIEKKLLTFLCIFVQKPKNANGRKSIRQGFIG